MQNEAEVAWIAGTHVDPSRDIEITTGPVDDLDDAAILPAFGGKMGIDATRKWPSEGVTREFPKRLVDDRRGARRRPSRSGRGSQQEPMTRHVSDFEAEGRRRRAVQRARGGARAGVAGSRRASACSAKLARQARVRRRRHVRPRAASRGRRSVPASTSGDAGEVRLAGAPASVDEAVELGAARGGRSPDGMPLTGFSLARSARAVRRRPPGARGSARARLARGRARRGGRVSARSLGDTDNAVEVVRAVEHGGLARLAPDDRSRRRIDERLDLIERAAAVQREIGRVRAFAPLPRLDPADAPVDRLRRRADGRGGAADVRDDPVHPGGLAALRPEARAGGDRVRRQRHRRRGRDRRGRPRAAALAARRHRAADSRRRGRCRSSATAATSRAS